MRALVVGLVVSWGLFASGVAIAAAPNCGGAPATIVGTPRPDVILGTPGLDVIQGFGGGDLIRGLGHADFICGGGGADRIYGGTGADEINGNAGADVLRGGAGNDVLRDGSGADIMAGGRGPDDILAAAGPDKVYGGPGRDAIQDSTGNDIVRMDKGDDELVVTPSGGADSYDGGDGVDVIRGGSIVGPLLVDLREGRLEAASTGSDPAHSFETVSGTTDEDTLLGNAADNLLQGGGGNDHIAGRGGDDGLDGDEGDDLLNGGPGTDRLQGGPGTDECLNGETVLNCEGPVVRSDFSQPHFRIRSDDSQTLNADAGWAAALDTNVTMDVEKKFRIRFEVENSGAAVNIGFKLQYRKNGGAWIDAAVVTNEAAPAVTESVEIRPSAQYADGDATTNILSGSSATFAAGTGNEDNDTGLWNNGTAHGEFEWAVLIRRTFGTFPNSPTGHNVDGDEFEFRLSTTAGDAFSERVLLPKVTLNVPARLLGGTIVETPGRMGPHKDGNGNLYYLMEYSETYPLAALMKSGDGGNTWVPQDVLSPPEKRDWESADILISGTELKVFQQQGQNVFFHTFRTSEDGTPDTWNIKDEVAAATQPSTNTNQCASLVRRSDGSFVAFFCEDLSSSFGRVAYNVRSSGGTWGTEVIIDSEASTAFEWAVGVLGESDLTHIFYLDRTNGIVYYRTLTSGGTLSGRTQIATGLTGSGDSNIAGILPAVYYDDAGAEKVLVVYKKSDDKLYAVTVTDGTPGSEQAVTSEPVVSNVGGSHSPGAALVVDGTTAYVVYGDNSTKDLWLRSSVNGAAWSSATEIEDNVTVDLVTASVFTHSAGNGGDKVIGYVFDNGSEGFTGKLTYGEHILQQGTPPPVGSSGSGSK